MQRSKLALVLTIVAILGLVFAGSAFADTRMTGKLNVTMNTNNGPYVDYGYTGCESSYIFNAYDITYFDTGCLNHNDGFKIIMDFNYEGDAENAFEFDFDYSLPVKVWAQTPGGSAGDWFTAQPTVIDVDEANGVVTIEVEDLMIPTEYEDITKVVVGDENQDLRVINTCEAGTYCIDMTISSKCGDFKVTDQVVEIKSAPAEVVITSIAPDTVQSGDCKRCFTVKGWVYDCGGKGVPNQDVTLTIPGADVDVANAKTNSNGFFTINFAGAIAPGDYTVQVSAEAGCGDAFDDIALKVNKRQASDLEINVTSADGVEDEVRYNKCNTVEFCLLDECGEFAQAGALEGNETTIYFTATQERPGKDPIVAGHFYLECPEICEMHYPEQCDCNPGDRDYEQINSIAVDAKSCYTVKMVPLVEGEITITARITIGGITEIVTTKVVDSFSPAEVMMDLFPLVTDDADNVRAGWPIVAAVALDRTAGANYNVNFFINGEEVLVSDQLGTPGVDYIAPMKDDEFVAAFNVCGESYCDQGQDACASEDAIFPYCTDKWYFMLYPCKELRGDFEIKVVIDGIGEASADFFTKHREGVSEEIDLNFVTPVELERYLSPDAWQTFSTPKLLAATGAETPEYGTFAELLAPIYEEMAEGPFSADEAELFVLGYDDGEWYAMEACDFVEPLAGYYVRTPQREKGDWNMRNVPFKLEYVFARATTPDLSVPYHYYYDTNDDNVGSLDYMEWNSIGVGVSPELENTLTRQSDDSAQALVTLLRGNASFSIWNPGAKLANVNSAFTTNALGGTAYSNTTLNPFTPLYNGDVYWTYGYCSNQYLAANVGLDMIEWVGGNYRPANYDDFPHGNEGY